MATRTITENVNQAVQDFDNIKQAIIDKGIEVPAGTPTSEYANKIETIKSGGWDTSCITNFKSFFSLNKNITSEDLTGLNTSNGTNFNQMFKDCKSLTTIPQLDTSSGDDFSLMFLGCTSLKTIELTSFISSYNMFSNCQALENLTVTGTITVNDSNLDLSSSPLLTVDSLMSVINALADNTGKTTYTVTLGSTNLAKLTDEQKQIAINKNYTLV